MNDFLVTMEREAEEAELRAAAYRKIIEAARVLGDEGIAHLRTLVEPPEGNGGNGHAALAPAATPDPPEDEPRGREAVRRIVHERPGLWALSDLRAEMKRRKWFTSNKGVDVAVTRLVASGEARRVGKGRYEFFAPNERIML
jgi:hypothetical protein